MILVTGATGFLGRRVVKLLARQGYSVLVLSRRLPDDLASAHRHDVSFLQVDLMAGSLDWGQSSLAGVEIVVHLAGVMDSGIDATRANVALGLNILDHAPEWIRGFVVASSAYVYSPEVDRWIDESTPPRPSTDYSHAKLFLEGIFSVEAEQRGCPAFILRIASLYGPGDPHGKAITKLVGAVRQGRPPLLRGDVHARRDYLHVDDAARAVVAAVRRVYEGAQGGTYNICSGVGTSIYQIALALCEMANVPPLASPAEPAAETADLVFDPRHAERDLGLKTRIPLDEGLLQCLEHH